MPWKNHRRSQHGITTPFLTFCLHIQRAPAEIVSLGSGYVSSALLTTKMSIMII